MMDPHYSGRYVDGKPVVCYCDGTTERRLSEVCSQLGFDDPGEPDWLAGSTGLAIMARLILWHATRDLSFVDDMERMFAEILAGGAKRERWAVSVETVQAWAVRHGPLRRQLRQLYGRDCPGCG